MESNTTTITELDRIIVLRYYKTEDNRSFRITTEYSGEFLFEALKGTDAGRYIIEELKEPVGKIIDSRGYFETKKKAMDGKKTQRG